MLNINTKDYNYIIARLHVGGLECMNELIRTLILKIDNKERVFTSLEGGVEEFHYYDGLVYKYTPAIHPVIGNGDEKYPDTIYLPKLGVICIPVSLATPQPADRDFYQHLFPGCKAITGTIIFGEIKVGSEVIKGVITSLPGPMRGMRARLEKDVTPQQGEIFPKTVINVPMDEVANPNGQQVCTLEPVREVETESEIINRINASKPVNDGVFEVKAPPIMRFDPATCVKQPYPSEAAQWRAYHGHCAWLFNPYTGERRTAEDIGSDVYGFALQTKTAGN